MTTSGLLSDLAASTAKATTVMASASTFIRGSAARTQAAIDKAMENGATAEQLAPIQAEVDAQNAGADDLAAAMVENTSAAPEGVAHKAKATGATKRV